MVSCDGAAIQRSSHQIRRIHRLRQDFSSPACSLCTDFLFSYAFSSDFLEFYMNLLYSSHIEKSINISPKKIPVSISASRYSENPVMISIYNFCFWSCLHFPANGSFLLLTEAVKLSFARYQGYLLLLCCLYS